MNDLIEFLKDNNIEYTTEHNKNNDLVINIEQFSIVRDETAVGKEEFVVANTANLNFQWMDIGELRLWLLNK